MNHGTVKHNASLPPAFCISFGAAMHYIERAYQAQKSGNHEQMAFLGHYLDQVRSELETAFDHLPEAVRKDVCQVLAKLDTGRNRPAPEKKKVKKSD